MGQYRVSNIPNIGDFICMAQSPVQALRMAMEKSEMDYRIEGRVFHKPLPANYAIVINMNSNKKYFYGLSF